MIQQPCDSCGALTEDPTCPRCLSERNRIAGYPAWSDSTPRPERGAHHDRRVSETRQHLTELPDLYALLPTFRLPGSTPPDPDQRSGKSNPAHRSVVNLDVIDLTDTRLKDDASDTRTDYGIDARAGARRQGVVNTLAAWSRLVCSELAEQGVESDLAEEPTITSECGYLLAHLDWIAEQQWFDDELHPDVRQILADVRRAVGDRDPIGYDCPDCGWQVVPRYGQTVYVCTGCERNWTMANEVDAFLAEQSSVMSLPDCARMIGKPLQNLNHWKAKGYLTPVGFDRKRRRDLYDVRIVQRLADTVRNGKRTEVSA